MLFTSSDPSPILSRAPFPCLAFSICATRPDPGRSFHLDLLQEPNTRPGNITSGTSTFVKGPLPRDRFLHECDGAAHRGMCRFLGSTPQFGTGAFPLSFI